MDADEQQRLFCQWLDRHLGLVMKVVRAHAYTDHDRDDLAQEVSFQLWRSLPNYGGEVAETTWTYRVALYTAAGWSRKEGNRKRRSRSMEGQEHKVVSELKPRDKRLDWLHEQIAKLDAIDRSLAVMMLDGCSYKQMSDVLGISESYVGVKINRLKNHLKDRLKARDPDEF